MSLKRTVCFAACCASFACGALACGAPAPLEVTGAPSTDRDPPAYVPPPSSRASTGTSTGLATSTNLDQARAIVVRVLRAVVEGDELTLTSLLSPTLGRAAPRLTPRQVARGDLMQVILQHPRRASLALNGVSVEELVWVDQITVTPLGSSTMANRIPPGFEQQDLYITVNLRPRGRMLLSALIPGWRAFGAMVVRTNAQDGRVIAL